MLYTEAVHTVIQSAISSLYEVLYKDFPTIDTIILLDAVSSLTEDLHPEEGETYEDDVVELWTMAHELIEEALSEAVEDPYAEISGRLERMDYLMRVLVDASVTGRVRILKGEPVS